MTTSDFTTAISVDQSPAEVFQAINNVKGWWSEQVEGGTEQLNDEFKYHFQDVHLCRMRLAEVIPNRKVVWLVLDNYFKFAQDQTEWINTTVSFDISEKEGKTQLVFTHHGLLPEHECYEICSNAWTGYLQKSLFNLITTGQGQPNGKDKPQTEDEKDWDSLIKTLKMITKEDFTLSFTVNATPQEVFRSINDVRKWWTENLEGSSEGLNDEFTVRFGDVHASTQKLTEFIPDQKVSWLITDSQLNFIENKQEWNGTTISFEITEDKGQTRIFFTHQGLVPDIECFKACSGAWTDYLENSLKSLIDSGEGQPGKS